MALTVPEQACERGVLDWTLIELSCLGQCLKFVWCLYKPSCLIEIFAAYDSVGDSHDSKRYEGLHQHNEGTDVVIHKYSNQSLSLCIHWHAYSEEMHQVELRDPWILEDVSRIECTFHSCVSTYHVRPKRVDESLILSFALNNDR